MKKLLYRLLFVPIAMFGQENYSLDFTNNTVDYVAIDSGLEFQSLESVSFVVKTKKQAEISFWDGALFDISDGECNNCWSNRYSLGIENNEVNFGLEGTSSPGGSVSSGIHQIEGEWVYIVIIGDVILNEVRMYLNGNLVGSEQLSNSENLFSLGTGNDNSKILGKRSSLTPFSREFHGFIDEFHIWDKPLSNNEIQEYMMCNPSGNEEGLIAYWSFNEGSGDTAYDLSGNGNHGVIYDVAYSEDVPEETCSSII